MDMPPRSQPMGRPQSRSDQFLIDEMRLVYQEHVLAGSPTTAPKAAVDRLKDLDWNMDGVARFAFWQTHMAEIKEPL